jgi:phage host-nuclease inhibitor protein Gam
MAKRITTPAIEEISEQELETKLSEYATKFNELETLETTLNSKITELRDKYQHKITEAKDSLDRTLKVIHFWAEKNKDRFDKKRSMDMHHGQIGFRTGTPKLKTGKGFTWASITVLLLDLAPQFIRVKNECEKDLLLAKREDEETQTLMKKVGIEVVQDESFFINLKKEHIIS